MRMRETILVTMICQVPIIEIRLKVTEQEPILIPDFENNANQAAVAGFQYWIGIQNCETILVRMVSRLLKSVIK